jgi:hypothetical protein
LRPRVKRSFISSTLDVVIGEVCRDRSEAGAASVAQGTGRKAKLLANNIGLNIFIGLLCDHFSK